MMKMGNSMGERNCALALGLLFVFLGIAGFIPAFVSMPGSHPGYAPVNAAPGLYSYGFGYLFGLFPTNYVHNIVHLIVGLSGLAATTDDRAARVYNRLFAYAYIVIGILGIIPFARTLFGLMPIFGNNVWFNLLAAIPAAYFGFIKPMSETKDIPVPNYKQF